MFHVIQDDVLLFRHYRLYDPGLLTYIKYFHGPFRAVILHQQLHLIPRRFKGQFDDLSRVSKNLLRLTHDLPATSTHEKSPKGYHMSIQLQKLKLEVLQSQTPLLQYWLID